MNGRNPLPSALGPRHLGAVLLLDQRALGGFWSEAQWAHELRESRHLISGLWQRARLVALASGALVVDELHISLVLTDPDHRRCGLGRQVLTHLLERGFEQGAQHATLEVSAANAPALALYAAAGFSTAGVRRAYYRNGDDALIQWLRIRPQQAMDQ